MGSLPYRAMVFLRQGPMRAMHIADGPDDIERQRGQDGAIPLDLMERCFAREADAVQWCSVMSEAEPQATGAWFVTASRGGRMMRITREAGLSSTIGVAAVGSSAEALGDVLAAAGMPASPALTSEPVRLKPVGSA